MLHSLLLLFRQIARTLIPLLQVSEGRMRSCSALAAVGGCRWHESAADGLRNHIDVLDWIAAGSLYGIHQLEKKGVEVQGLWAGRGVESEESFWLGVV